MSLGLLQVPAPWAGMSDWLAPCWEKPSRYFFTAFDRFVFLVFSLRFRRVMER